MITRGDTVETYNGIELFEATDGYGISGIGYLHTSGAFEGPFCSVSWAQRSIDSYYPQPKPKPAPRTYVVADCGHEVAEGMAMSSSHGTCCPECYDRMSD